MTRATRSLGRVRWALACCLLLSLGLAPQSGRPTVGNASVGPKEHDGVTARDAMPGRLHLRNVGGSDGAGLCVFASISHAARYQGLDELADMMDWMRSFPGGGYPEKVDEMIRRKLGPDHGVSYLHVYGPESLELLALACASGYQPCVTYGYGERYGVSIAHMVSLVHLDDERAAILDNNFPGDDAYEWMSRDEFAARYAWSPSGLGEGWGIIFTSGEPQPPEPRP